MKSQLVSLCIGSLCFVSSYSLNAQESWQSQLVIQDEYKDAIDLTSSL